MRGSGVEVAWGQGLRRWTTEPWLTQLPNCHQPPPTVVQELYISQMGGMAGTLPREYSALKNLKVGWGVYGVQVV